MLDSARTLRSVLAAACTLLACERGVAQLFSDVTSAPMNTVGLDIGASIGTGMCAEDFDGDGDLDVVVTAPGQVPRYFRNEGAFVFTDQTAASGFTTLLTRSRGCVAADIDNDGDQDLFLGQHHEFPTLWINDGSGHFVNEAMQRGITSATSIWGACFGDVDGDGWLDLYLANRGTPTGTAGQANILYRNVGNGVFQDVTSESVTGQAGLAFVCTFMDYNEDFLPDIYVVNDKGTNQLPNELYRNLGGFQFEAVGAAVQANDAVDGMGVDFCDVFCDGGLDYYVTDLPPDHVFREWDPVNEVFVDRTYPLNLMGQGVGWATQFMDYDNDGWQDLHIVHNQSPNFLYKHPGDSVSAWTEIGGNQLPSEFQTSAICSDFDGDGRIDVLHRMLFSSNPSTPGVRLDRNDAPPQNWLRVELEGRVSNRDGRGARVEVVALNRRQRQYVRSGIGFMSGGDRRCHFGLADAPTATVLVYWPSGNWQQVDNVAVNQVLRIVEPTFVMPDAPALGGINTLELLVPHENGAYYLTLLSGSDGALTPLINGLSLPITVDAITGSALTPGNGLLYNGIGTVANGTARSYLTLPVLPAGQGMKLFATAITVDPVTAGIGTVFGSALQIDVTP